VTPALPVEGGAAAERAAAIAAAIGFGSQWAADHPPEPDRWAPFHFLVKGSCVIELREAAD
jgi:hypothetical protein